MVAIGGGLFISKLVTVPIAMANEAHTEKEALERTSSTLEEQVVTLRAPPPPPTNNPDGHRVVLARMYISEPTRPGRFAYTVFRLIENFETG